MGAGSEKTQRSIVKIIESGGKKRAGSFEVIDPSSRRVSELSKLSPEFGPAVTPAGKAI
jgi:hypothetical protein